MSHVGVDLSSYDETQVLLMNEKCILVNENDEILGYESKKNCKNVFSLIIPYIVN